MTMANNKRTMFYGATPEIFARAQGLREQETMAEKLLWSELSNKQLGIKFRRQHPINQYIVDFYSHELKIVIEVDGLIHLRDDIIEKDKLREQQIQSLDLIVIRFTNDEIFQNLKGVVERIRRVIIERKKAL
jgi:cyclase